MGGRWCAGCHSERWLSVFMISEDPLMCQSCAWQSSNRRQLSPGGGGRTEGLTQGLKGMPSSTTCRVVTRDAGGLFWYSSGPVGYQGQVWLWASLTSQQPLVLGSHHCLFTQGHRGWRLTLPLLMGQLFDELQSYFFSDINVHYRVKAEENRSLDRGPWLSPWPPEAESWVKS